MSALLRDAWIQVFGGVVVLCLIIMGADRLASRPPDLASPVPPLASRPASAIQHPDGEGGLSRPFDAPALSAPARVTIASKLVPSPMTIPLADSNVAGDSEPGPVPATPARKAELKIIRLSGPTRWNTDIFRKKK